MPPKNQGNRLRLFTAIPCAACAAMMLSVVPLVCLPGAGLGAAWWQGSTQAGTDAPPAAASRFFVLAVVAGLEPAMLNIFLQSWHRFSPHTRIVLWVEEGTTLDDHGLPVEVIRFSQTTDNNLVKLQRYALYKSFLEELLRQVYTGGVVLADARDVFIQSDPWQDLTIRKLVRQVCASLEGRPEDGEGKPIRDSVANHRWIDICFGKATLKNVSNLPISCSGVTVGGIGAVAAYVYQLLHVAFHIAKRGSRFSGGSDQGVHNDMLHVLGPSGQLNFTYHVLKNWDSPVFTAGHGWPHHLDSFGVYRRGDGSGTEGNQMLPPPIVHQYDKRGGGITLLMRAMYPVLTEEYRVLGPERGDEAPPLSAWLAACRFC